MPGSALDLCSGQRDQHGCEVREGFWKRRTEKRKLITKSVGSSTAYPEGRSRIILSKPLHSSAMLSPPLSVREHWSMWLVSIFNAASCLTCSGMVSNDAVNKTSLSTYSTKSLLGTWKF